MSTTNAIETLPETPFLAVDLDLLERNITRMARTIIQEGGKNWRPHTKAIKCPGLAHKLLAAGAIGVTCAKLSEAEVMVNAGISDILIANQIVVPTKLRRLAQLNRHARVIAAVDDVDNVDQMERIAAELDTPIPIVVEVDIGITRCGVAPGEPVVQLATEIAARKHVQFAGVMGWEGHTTQIADPAAKKKAIHESVALLVSSVHACRQAGLAVEVVSCGGTGTYAVTSQIDGVTELQAGGGIFGDLRYRDDYHVDHDCALTIWTTVISRPTPTRVIVDAGWKAMACFPKAPEPIGLDEVKGVTLNAEHTRIELATPAPSPRVGERIEFAAGYSDSTVCLHDTLFALRSGRLELALPLLARGKLQ